MERVRLNLIIERGEDDLVFQELTAVAKGPKRIAKAKRMLHVAALIARGLMPPQAGAALPSAPSVRAPAQPSSDARTRSAQEAERDVDTFFGPVA